MFLSKIFGIFKKKKDNPQDVNQANPQSSGAVAPNTGTVGAAVGISQPSQDVQPATPTFSVDQQTPTPPEPSFTPPAPIEPQSVAQTPQLSDSDVAVAPPAQDITPPVAGGESSPLASADQSPDTTSGLTFDNSDPNQSPTTGNTDGQPSGADTAAATPPSDPNDAVNTPDVGAVNNDDNNIAV